MLEHCSTNSLQDDERRIVLQREYSALSEQLRTCWEEDSSNADRIKFISGQLYDVYRELREIKVPEDTLSPEARKILCDADLNTLTALYRTCQKEKVPYGDLISELEKEIYHRWIHENHIDIVHVYKLDQSLTYQKE